ncbi:MAG: hypothetical protein WCH37_05350, partial [Synechococcaceae cyanobacterium ELA182]
MNLGPVSGKISITDTPRLNLVPSEVNLNSNQPNSNTFKFSNPTCLSNGIKVRPIYDDGIINNNGVYESTTASPVGGVSRDLIYKVKLLSQDGSGTFIQLLDDQERLVALSSWDQNRNFSLTPISDVTRTHYTFNAASATNPQPSITIKHQLFDPAEAGKSNDPYLDDPSKPTETVTPIPTQNEGGSLYLTPYNPLTGLAYSWALGQSKTTTTVKTWEQQTFNLIGWDWKFGNDPIEPPLSVQTTFTDQQPLLQGQALLPAVPTGWQADDVYSVVYNNRLVDAAKITVDSWTTGGGWLRKKTYHTQTTTIQGSKDIYTNILKADYPIAVGFLDRDPAGAGQLRINSGGGILLQNGADASGGIDLSSSSGDITVRNLLNGDNTPLQLLAAQGSINLQLGANTAATPNLTLSAQAGGDLNVAMIANQGSTAALRPLATGTGAAGLQAGGSLTISSAGRLDLSDQLNLAADQPLLKANRIELDLGAGSLGTSAQPLRIDTGDNLSSGSGLALRLASAGPGEATSAAALREIRGSLSLVAPASFLSNHAVEVDGDLQLTVDQGALLDASQSLTTVVDEVSLKLLDDTYKFTGEAAILAARDELRRQDSANYTNYWITYRNARQADGGQWIADPEPPSPFQFTAEQNAQLALPPSEGGHGMNVQQINSYQAQINQVQIDTGTGVYDPNYAYQRPIDQQIAYEQQRVVSYNLYYHPLDQAVYQELFPLQAQAAGAPAATTRLSAASQSAAISANNLTIVINGSIGSSGAIERILVPGGDYNQLSDADAQLISNATIDDVVGRTYQVVRYIGDTPLDISQGLPPLDDATLFTAYQPDFIAGDGPVYRYLGTPQTDQSLAEVNFNAKGTDQQPLWEVVAPDAAASISYNTTAVGVTLNPGVLVRDTRADLVNGSVVLVNSPALYGFYRYAGQPQRLDLLLSDFGLGSGSGPSPWSEMLEGTQQAPLTPQKPPASGIVSTSVGSWLHSRNAFTGWSRMSDSSMNPALNIATAICITPARRNVAVCASVASKQITWSRAISSSSA